MKVLVVEDDKGLVEVITAVLREESFEVDTALAGDEGLYLAEQGIYDLVLLDIMLPGLDGFTMIQKLRERSVRTPILALTARDGVEDRVRGLNAGADDYLIKPFAVPELLARIRALLRRSGGYRDSGHLEFGPLVLKPAEQDGFVWGEPLQLTPREYVLLEYLVWNHGQIVTREQIYDRIWGFDSDTTLSIVDVYVHYVRKKLGAHGCGQLIRTVRGVGYMAKEG